MASSSPSTSPFLNSILHERLRACLFGFEFVLLDLVKLVKKGTLSWCNEAYSKFRSITFFKFLDLWSRFAGLSNAKCESVDVLLRFISLGEFLTGRIKVLLEYKYAI